MKYISFGALFVIYAQCTAEPNSSTPLRHRPTNSWNLRESKQVRFHPFSTIDIQIPGIGAGEKCLDDLSLLRQGVLNHSLWAALMVDATAAYPTGVLHGSRYYLGNFDGCMAAAKKSPIGARYCIARLTSDFKRSPERIGRSTHFEHDDFGEPDEMIPKEILVAVCVPQSCKESHLQQVMQQELQLLHPTITNVDVDLDLCTDGEDTKSDSAMIFRYVVTCLVALALIASTLDARGVVLSSNMQWILSWSLPRRWNELTAPEKPIRGIPLQFLSALRIISLFIVMFLHHATHILKRPTLNNYMRRAMYTDPSMAALTHAYMFLWTIMFISGLFFALKSQESFLRGIFLRYLRFTPSLLAVIAYYAIDLKSAGSGPLWKSIMHPEAQGCVNYWWANLLYIHNYASAPPNSPGCLLQSWSVCADMQLCVLATLLLFAMKKWKNGRTAFLGVAIALAVSGPFVTTLNGMRGPTWVFGESELIKPWSARPKLRRYVATENWALPYLTGLCTGLFLERSVKEGVKLSHGFVAIAVPSTLVTMLMLSVSNVYWSLPGVDQHSVQAALFSVFAPTIWSLCIALLTASFALGPKTRIVSFLSAPLFVIIGRLGYSMYLVHFGVQLALVGQQRAPIYVSAVNMTVTGVHELVWILPVCLFICLFIEAPTRELSKDLFKTKSVMPATCDNIKQENGIKSLGTSLGETSELQQTNHHKSKLN